MRERHPRPLGYPSNHVVRPCAVILAVAEDSSPFLPKAGVIASSLPLPPPPLALPMSPLSSSSLDKTMTSAPGSPASRTGGAPPPLALGTGGGAPPCTPCRRPSPRTIPSPTGPPLPPAHLPSSSELDPAAAFHPTQNSGGPRCRAVGPIKCRTRGRPARWSGRIQASDFYGCADP